MKKSILGKKLGMTQVFTTSGMVIPVTVVEAGPCTVIQKKTQEKDGYDAVVVGFGEQKEKLVNKPQAGVFKKAGVSAKKYLREIQPDNYAELEVGSTITCDVFNEGDMVDVTGITKGHGFTGNIKRHNARRLKMTHGTGPVHREVGSMSANSTPSRVFKNKLMPGHYGDEQVTIQNLQIVKVDKERNVLLIKGAIPGSKNALVTVTTAVKA